MREEHFVLQMRRIPAWRLALSVVVGVLMLTVVAAFAFAAFVVLAPVIAGLVGWQAWKLSRAAKKRGFGGAEADVVDAEFVVIERPTIEAPRKRAE
jgi:hypothetical protein